MHPTKLYLLQESSAEQGEGVPPCLTMVIAIMVFSAHWVTTPRLCLENLELSLSAHSLSSQRIKGDASDHVSLSALDLLKTIVYLK